MFHPEASQLLRIKGRWGRRLPIQVDDGAAAPADQVGMPEGFGIIMGHFVEWVHLDDQTLQIKDFQGLINGVERDGGKLPAHLLVNLLGAG